MAETEDDGLARVKRAVCHIALGYRLNAHGARKRISRDQQTDIARAVCLKMGWSWVGQEDGDTI